MPATGCRLRSAAVSAPGQRTRSGALAPLKADGWRLRHSLPWRGRGDIDSVAIAPTGVGFVVETKTRAYDDRHLAQVRAQAAWLSRRRRPWCRRGAVPVVCLIRARGVHRLEQTVLVVSIDWLIPVLRSCACRPAPASSARVDASIAASISGERGRIGSLAPGAHGTEFPACRAMRVSGRGVQDACAGNEARLPKRSARPD